MLLGICLSFSAANDRISPPEAKRQAGPCTPGASLLWLERVWSCLIKPRRAGEPGNTKSGWLVLVDNREPTRMRKRRQFVTFSKSPPASDPRWKPCKQRLGNPGIMCKRDDFRRADSQIRILFASIICIESQDNATHHCTVGPLAYWLWRVRRCSLKGRDTARWVGGPK